MNVGNKILRVTGVLTLMALGLFSLNSIGQMDEEIAPYRYGNVKPVNHLKLLNKQERFLKKRLRVTPSSGLDKAALAGVYAAKSSLTGDLSLMDRAEKTAQESLINLPFQNEGALLILIRVAEARHDFSRAIASGKKLLSENIGNSGILSTLVSSHLGHGKSQEANEYANKLVRAAPFMDSFALRALTLLAQGRNEEAMRDFKKALSIEEADQRLSSTSLRTLMGRHYYRMGQMDTALLYTESALKIDPDYHVALAQKADIRAAQRNSEEAIRLYRRAYKEREEPPYLLAQANLQEQAGDLNEAERLRSEAEKSVRSEIDTTPYGHYNELAQILIDRGSPSQREEAIVAAQKNVEQRMTSESYLLLAQAFLNAERLDEARAAIQSALKSGETNCEYAHLSLKIEDLAAGGDGQIDNSMCPQARI